MSTTSAPELEDPPASRPSFLRRALTGMRPGFRVALLGTAATLLGLVAQASIGLWLTVSLAETEPGARAACAVGLEKPLGLWCAMVEADLPEPPTQYPVTPVNAAQMCAYFVRLGDPAGGTEDDRKCGFAYREGEQRITGSLSFQGPGLTPAGLDRQVRYDELWSNSPWEEPLDPDLTLSRPRPDILIHRMPRASEEIHAFTVTCGSFDLTGWVRTLDATEVAVALADRWCPAS